MKKLNAIQKICLLVAVAGAFSLYAKVTSLDPTDPEAFVPVVESQTDSTTYKHIESILNEAYKKGRFNGVVLYAEQGKILYHSAFGYDDFRKKTPLTDTSVFQLASTSKPFTAIAILKLYQTKKLDIDQPVVFYLPDFPYPNVTIKHLLQHRSGLPNYIYLTHNRWDIRQPMHNKDISPLIRKSKAKLTFTPGSRFQYCNTNYAYLASIVEKVSGVDFPTYMKKEIFDPLGMRRSFVYTPDCPLTTLAVKGYDYTRKRGFYERKNDYLDGVVGDKGVYSTASDLFLFDQALYTAELLAKDLIDKAFSPSVGFSETPNRDYGLGFRVKLEEDGQQMAYHHGWWKGFRTFFVHDYQKRRTLIWLNNRSDVQVSPSMNEILRNNIADEESSVLGGGDR